MKWFIVSILISCVSYSQEADVVLDDPMVSLHCKELIKERNMKLDVKHRLNSFLQRNRDLIKRSPKNKKTAILTLESNQKKVKTALHDTLVRIKQMEENIVRNGCPGINL
jgi:siroheme synthase